MTKIQKGVLIAVLGSIAVVVIGISALGFWGWNLFKDDAKDAFNQNPVIQHYIGEIDTLHVDLIATGEAENEDVFVFKVEGSKSSGVVSAEFITLDVETEGIRSGWLELPSGERYDLL